MNLKELFTRCAPLPWDAVYTGTHRVTVKAQHAGAKAQQPQREVCYTYEQSDAALITHAVNILPKLVAGMETALRELRLSQGVFVDSDPNLQPPVITLLEQLLDEANNPEGIQ